MVYRWRENSRRPGKAQEVGETLEALRTENGGSLTPGAVVEEARDEGSVLHRYFEWDDAKAAEAHRLHSARDLIADVSVVYAEVENAPKEPVRAFSSLSGAGMAYTSTLEAMQSPELRAVVLASAKKELDGWRRRYRHISELARAVELAEAAAQAIPEPETVAA